MWVRSSVYLPPGITKIHSLLFAQIPLSFVFMTDISPDASESTTNDTSTMGNPVDQSNQNDFSDQYNDVMGKVNETLNKIDWGQMGKYGKAVGIIAVVIIAQVVIKGVIDTINLLPILPGLLELLGVVVVGQWSWQNLTTSDKRDAVFQRIQNLRKEYLG